jgi:hypothetical protein
MALGMPPAVPYLRRIRFAPTERPQIQYFTSRDAARASTRTPPNVDGVGLFRPLPDYLQTKQSSSAERSNTVETPLTLPYTRRYVIHAWMAPH